MVAVAEECLLVVALPTQEETLILMMMILFSAAAEEDIDIDCIVLFRLPEIVKESPNPMVLCAPTAKGEILIPREKEEWFCPVNPWRNFSLTQITTYLYLKIKI